MSEYYFMYIENKDGLDIRDTEYKISELTNLGFRFLVDAPSLFSYEYDDKNKNESTWYCTNSVHMCMLDLIKNCVEHEEEFILSDLEYLFKDNLMVFKRKGDSGKFIKIKKVLKALDEVYTDVILDDCGEFVDDLEKTVIKCMGKYTQCYIKSELSETVIQVDNTPTGLVYGGSKSKNRFLKNLLDIIIDDDSFFIVEVLTDQKINNKIAKEIYGFWVDDETNIISNHANEVSVYIKQLNNIDLSHVIFRDMSGNHICDL